MGKQELLLAGWQNEELRVHYIHLYLLAERRGLWTHGFARHQPQLANLTT
jgi:hypothetical protein